MLVAVAAVIELRYRVLDRYDKCFLAMFLTACGLSFVWLCIGVPEPAFVVGAGVLVLIPLSMYLCLKLSVRSPEDLAGLIGAFVLGAFVDACFAGYEAIALGHAYRPGGLSGAAPENLALHSGLAFAFVLYPYPGRRRATWLSILVRTIAGAVFCFSVIVSGTRAAWLGLLFSTVALACVMALSRSQRGRLLKVLVPAALLITAALAFNVGPSLKRGASDLASALEERVSSDGAQNGAGRIEIWGQAVDVASDYYFMGGGFSGFMQGTSKRAAAFQTIARKELEYGKGAHNIFLEALVDYGPSSFLLLSVCLTTLVAMLFRKARNAKEELSSHGMLYSLLFLIVCGLFRGLFDMQDFWIIMAFITLFVRFHMFHVPSRFHLRTTQNESQRTHVAHRLPSPGIRFPQTREAVKRFSPGMANLTRGGHSAC